MIMLLYAPLSVWAEVTPLHPSIRGEEVSDASDRSINRPYLFLANDNLPPMTYMQDEKYLEIRVLVYERSLGRSYTYTSRDMSGVL